MTSISGGSFSQPTRRQFVQATAGVAGLSGLAAADALFAKPQVKFGHGGAFKIPPGSTILFQGDSITDFGRDRAQAAKPNSQPALGSGYAWLTAMQLLVDRPNAKLKIYNRGVSGNKVFELADRWQEDCLDLKPDVLSILIGVNDYWHKHDGHYDGTVEIYERDYRALIKRTKAALPGVKLVICEPFVLRCGAVNDTWFPEWAGYAPAAKRVADAAGAVFVPFQAMFDEAVKFAPPNVWAADGVHPTASGATLMAHWWLKAVGA
jgi:lysophospholipase L1-like esterase